MNAISLSFLADAGIASPSQLMTADANVQRAVMAAWKKQTDAHAFSFRDQAREFLTNDQIGRAFLTPQLHRVEAEVYMTRRPEFDIASYITVNEDGDMWDVGTVFYSMDEVGRAEFLSGKGFDMPYAGTSMDQFTHGFHLAGIGYEYTMQEMGRAAKMGRSLNADKASAAKKSADIFKRSIMMTGRTPGAATSEKGWTGLINNPSVPTANFAADGTGASRLWSTKTPDQIVRDFYEAVNAVEVATLETHLARTVLLSTSRLRYLENTRMSDTGSSILDYLRGAREGGEAITIRGVRELETAGAGGTARMIAYDNSREVAQFHLPADHEFIEPLRKGSMTWEVGGILNVGGTEMRLPKAAAYRDGL